MTDMLRKKIKDNPNLTDEFKCNLGTLTDSLLGIFPDYDYTYLMDKLSALKVSKSNTIAGYSSYNNNDNELFINTRKAFDDGIDLQHLFMKELLSIGTHKKEKNASMEGFYKGMTEAIASLINPDESIKKVDPLESIGISIFSKITGADALIDSYMKDDLSILLLALESQGISSVDFSVLLNNFNNAKEDFLGLERTLNLMFEKRMNFGIQSGVINNDNLEHAYKSFADMLIYNKAELIALYKGHDFSSVSSLATLTNDVTSSINRLEKNIVASNTSYHK